MYLTTLGDLAQFFTLRSHNASLQAQLNDRVNELATGEVSDKSGHLAGNFTNLSGIERSIDLNESYLQVRAMASTFVDNQASAFSEAYSKTYETGTSLLAAAEANLEQQDAVLAESRNVFDMVLSRLNASSGGRSLFAGAAVQTAAFASADSILASFSSALATATTADDVMTIADTWFDSGGDYDTVAYQGSFTPLSGFKVGESEVVEPALSGDNSEIRDLVKLHAIAAIVADESVTLINAERENLMISIGEEMINLNTTLIAKEAEIGAIQRRVEEVGVSLEAKKYSLLISRDELIGIDTADTALWLNETETQLESLYTVTARLSNLSLTAYI